MIYYRLASQKRQSAEWEWKSPALNSLEALFRLSQRYRAIPADRLRVFLASSVVYMDILLVRENLGLPSNSLTLDQLLHDHSCINTPQIRRFEQEMGWPEETAPFAQAWAIQAAEHEQTQRAQQEPEVSSPVACAVDHEQGGGDHDVPYTFAFPRFLPQARAWMRLRERVLAGELVS